MMVWRNLMASAFGRWKEFRPMMLPNPPPSRIPRASSNTFLSSLFAPPEKITIRRPSNELCTTCLTRSASVLIGICVDSYTFFAAACSKCAVGNFTLMICAPSCAAICAANCGHEAGGGLGISQQAIANCFEMGRFILSFPILNNSSFD